MIAIISTIHGAGFGSEAVLDYLLRGWSRAYPPLQIITPMPSRIAETAQLLGWPVIPLETKRDSLWCNFQALRKVIRQLQHCESVHAWHARGFELAWRLGRKLGIPATGTLHDHPKSYYHGFGRRWLIRNSANHFSELVCVSQAVAGTLGPAGIQVPWRVIYNGLHNAPMSPREVSRNTKPVQIGFLGMYSSVKGFEIVMHWIEHMTADNVHWNLYGEVCSAWKNIAAKIGDRYPDKISFQGRQKTESIFSDNDVIVHPSTKFDSLPTTIMEAARAGLPCVASSIGGAPEILDHDRTGFLFDPAKPDDGSFFVRALVSDLDLRRRMGLEARKKYEACFQIRQMVERYQLFWRALSVNKVQLAPV